MGPGRCGRGSLGFGASLAAVNDLCSDDFRIHRHTQSLFGQCRMLGQIRYQRCVSKCKRAARLVRRDPCSECGQFRLTIATLLFGCIPISLGSVEVRSSRVPRYLKRLQLRCETIDLAIECACLLKHRTCGFECGLCAAKSIACLLLSGGKSFRFSLRVMKFRFEFRHVLGTASGLSLGVFSRLPFGDESCCRPPTQQRFTPRVSFGLRGPCRLERCLRRSDTFSESCRRSVPLAIALEAGKRFSRQCKRRSHLSEFRFGIGTRDIIKPALIGDALLYLDKPEAEPVGLTLSCHSELSINAGTGEPLKQSGAIIGIGADESIEFALRKHHCARKLFCREPDTIADCLQCLGAGSTDPVTRIEIAELLTDVLERAIRFPASPPYRPACSVADLIAPDEINFGIALAGTVSQYGALIVRRDCFAAFSTDLTAGSICQPWKPVK